MLFLTRKAEEKIIIGDNEIVITVVGLKNDRVRLGFEADERIKIHRQEVLDNIQKHGVMKNHG